MPELRRTPLHAWHVARKARMVPFGGWDMPVQYTSILEEHKAVRTAAGLFDISHMGRLTVEGTDATRFVDRMFTNDPAGMKSGQVRYGFVLNAAGCTLDDILVTKWSPEAFEIVVNAGNRGKIVAWIDQHKTDCDVVITDRTFDLGMLAVQGPQAIALAEGLIAGVAVGGLKYYHASPAECLGAEAVVSRTGYTGEDGFEIIAPNAAIVSLADVLLQRGVVPCGLGCRDTLRLEAAMPLYGHELTEATNPIHAGLGWAVKPEKGNFLGREAILAALADPTPRPVRVGLTLTGKRAAREGANVLVNGTVIGTVTSGSYTPWLDRSIAMAYIQPHHTAIGTELTVDVRGTAIPATVTALPFYKRAK
ncbi:MAG: glycine cleavage system aminomethyltransferase GcvT [Bacteroidales bacterium]|nr:glycine cleavage system aminomethyltransferase GcvT [Bacteroidales bacterium]